MLAWLRHFNHHRLVTFLVALLPFLSLFLAIFWADYAGNLTIWGGTDAPKWWQHLGLNTEGWINVGLLPGVFCGIIGYIAILYGKTSRQTLILRAGVWCCITAPLIVFCYIGRTF